MKNPRFALTAGAVLLLAAPASAQTTMDALWPNADGLAWSYAQHYESYDVNQLVVDSHVRIFFDGPATAPNAIEAQYLRHQVIGGPALAATTGDLPADPFLRQLWIARPDLRPGIRQALDAGTCPQFAPGSYSLLLNGELAYRKTAEEIATWRCNLADTRSWMFLVADLTIGNNFTLQLVPDLASNVFLHGTIAAIEASTVPAGTFPGCVRVDYVVDYGTVQCTDQGGSPAGTYRSETRGAIFYAPHVGPVESREEFLPFAEATGTCATPQQIGQVLARTTQRLTLATVAARPTSWGRLKAIYR